MIGSSKYLYKKSDNIMVIPQNKRNLPKLEINKFSKKPSTNERLVKYIEYDNNEQ